MRSVNANLLEINQAKKEGKTNVDLNAPTTLDNTPGGSTPSGSGTTEGGSGNTEGGSSNTDQTGDDGQGSESGGDGNMG